ncbi:Metallo-beta-lactamase L1 precursor [Stieleria maiorica]|uniref:Metallo-beta-lactamase L1 n=1 Tax=Stieleria maiorica TaxID=2795974 RepID=A0A5B9MBE8_9BACT|nr:MBL fold metallo-hydrolase [Stieleria maiorica]QEF98601.1 Metallo-beta-lactamase L1 precursor [Stieleria maiorica]
METLVRRDAQSGAGPRQYATQWLGGKTLTVAPGVHVLGELSPSAVYAIETSDGIILIDSGSDELARGVRESLLSVGLRLEDVRYVLITHAHYDHVFGANRIRTLSGAVVAAGKDDCQVLRTPDLPALYSVFPIIPYSGAPIEVDRELVDGDRIDLGGVTVEAIAAPGHTPGSTCYLLTRDSQTILFCGDVISSIDFGPATYSAELAPKYRGDAGAFVATIDRLLEMGPPDLLLTGHPRQQKQLQSIRLDPATWQGMLGPARDELQSIVERHARDGADFLDGHPKPIEPGLYYLGDLDGIAVYGIFDQENFMVVNAPGGDAYEAFLSARLESLGLKTDLPAMILLTSDRPDHRSGLESMPANTVVVAPASIAATLRNEGMDVRTPADVSATLQLKPMETPLGVSYSYSANGREILLTPDVPRNVSLVWTNRLSGRKTMGDLQPQMEDLMGELAEAEGRLTAYRKTLLRMEQFQPDVWLPSRPLTDQNANLYDDEWDEIIENNLRPADAVERRF